jgi:hypothetical protein
MNIIYSLRSYWRELATWTRAYLFSRYSGIGNEKELFEHLYSLPEDYTTMLRLILGVQFSELYLDLFNERIITIRDLVSAHLEGNAEEMNQYVTRLYEISDRMSILISSVNPFLDSVKIRDLFNAYNQHIIDMANAFHSGEFEKGLESFDQILIHAETIGDYLSQGLSSFITNGNPQNGNQTTQQCITYNQMRYIFSIRDFWFDLAAWTRSYFISRLTGTGGEEESYLRLIRTVENYISRLRPILGDKISDEYLQQLYSYLSLIASLVSAQLEGNTEAASQITKQLYENADKRADFLSSINPFWEQSEWRNRLYRYTQSTLEEMTTFLYKDYSRSTDIFERLLTQSANTGDYFSQGLFNFIAQSKV